MTRFATFLALLLCCASAVYGAGGGGGSSGDGSAAQSSDPVIASARAAIAKQDWMAAQAGLKKALADKPNNADYHNLYAFSIRKGPSPDMDEVFRHYGEALRIDPRHRAAHEYMGEAYLQVNDLARAREHLAALDKLCFLPCEEFTDLKKEVGEYEAKNVAKGR